MNIGRRRVHSVERLVPDIQRAAVRHPAVQAAAPIKIDSTVRRVRVALPVVATFQALVAVRLRRC